MHLARRSDGGVVLEVEPTRRGEDLRPHLEIYGRYTGGIGEI